MPRTSKLLAAFLIFAAVGCAKPKPGDPPHSKVGVAVAPPPGQTVNYDPSVIGLGAAIGTTVYDSQGVILWLKYGAPLTSWRAVPVSPLVTGDPSQAPGLKAPIGFTVTMNDGSASWVKSTSSDTGWVTNPPTGVPDGGASITVNAPLSGAGTVGSPLAISAIPLTDLATQIQQTFVGNPVGSGTQSPVAMTATQATAALNVATSSVAGLMSAALFGAVQNLGEYSIDIDMTTTGDKGVVVPARAGQTFFPKSISQMVVSVTGTATNNPVVSIGVSSAFTNIVASSTMQSSTQINQGAGEITGANIAATIAPMVSNSDLHVAVVTAVTGSSALTCRVTLSGWWVTF